MNTRISQRGAIAIPFVIAFVAIASLLGALTETSLVLHARHKLFNGGETALLAAANLYNTGDATYSQEELNALIKSDYCDNNFLDPSNTELDFSQINNGTLILTSSKTVNVLFFKNALTLQCQLAASIPQTANHVSGAAPIAMLTKDFELGKSYTIKQSAGGKYSPGNYGALALGGTGASIYEDNFKNGYSGAIDLGASLDVEPGNIAGPTDDAVDYRLANGGDIVIVVLTNAFPKGASGTITVQGFAAFQITGSSNGEVTGTFVKYKIAAEASSTAAAYGVYSKAKLMYY